MSVDVAGAPIRWRLHIPALPDVIFAALDTNEGRAAFWAESAVEADSHIQFRFSNGVEYRSRVIERQPPSVLAIEYFGGHARFELTADGKGGTDLLLTHEGVAPDEWHEVHAGWLNVLFPLKAWIAHRVDLRNHDPERTWDAGYADG